MALSSFAIIAIRKALSLSSSLNNSNSLYLTRFYKIPRKVFVISLHQHYISFQQIDNKAYNKNICCNLKKLYSSNKILSYIERILYINENKRIIADIEFASYFLCVIWKCICFNGLF